MLDPLILLLMVGIVVDFIPVETIKGPKVVQTVMLVSFE